MKLTSVHGVRIGGLCACVPSFEVDNMDLGATLFGERIADVIKATGIHTRRVCPSGSGITALDLSISAARTLFSIHSLSPIDIGGILFVSQTPDYDIPNNSSVAAHLLGLPKSVAAVDSSFGCSGYVYGLWLGSLMARSLSAPVLLLDGETHSYLTSPYDRATALLFGDAGSATILLPEGSSVWHFGFFTDGSGRDALFIPEGRSRNLFNESSLRYKTWTDGGVRRPINIFMDGMAVFNFVVRNVPQCLATLMRESGVTVDRIDRLLLHQANLFMMKQVAKQLDIPQEKMPVSLDRFGNSSSATIPVTISAEMASDITDNCCNALMAGFGAGLSIAVAALDLGPCVCPGIIEYSDSTEDKQEAL